MNNIKRTGWCFTENLNAQTFYDTLEVLFESRKSHIKYICGQLETASTGQLHFQGYLQLKATNRLSWLQKNVSASAHWEAQKGTNPQAREYCMKDDTSTAPFKECGTFTKGKGERTDLTGFVQQIKEGATKRSLIDSDPNALAKYDRFYNTVRSLYKPKRPEAYEHKVLLFYGDTGTGKTRKALGDYPDIFEMPLQTSNTLWMDGYDGHTEVLLDDFAGKLSKLSCVNTLKLLDRYPIQVPIKGGFTWWMPDTLVITTNYHPRAWYDWSTREQSWAPLKRRFTEIWVFETSREPYEVIPDDFLEDRELWPKEGEPNVEREIPVINNIDYEARERRRLEIEARLESIRANQGSKPLRKN